MNLSQRNIFALGKIDPIVPISIGHSQVEELGKIY
jgi:hypothetical protein